jgi:hypothetical protein
MKAAKLVVVWLVTTLVTLLSWIIGSIIGNLVTNTTPPPQPSDPAVAGLIFLGVCAFNAILITALVSTSSNKRVLILFLFVVQFMLPQMETYFFASGMGIGYNQVTSIVISGLIVSAITITIITWLYKKLLPAPSNEVSFNIKASTAALLVIIGYPFLYLLFGRLVAWQSETVRIYYTSSPAMAPFTEQLKEVLTSGLYFFQILRAAIWLVVTIPIAMALKHKPILQFLFIGILSSLLPASLLFIPNPYMPWEVARVHFVEISISNFLWGVLMVSGVRRN